MYRGTTPPFTIVTDFDYSVLKEVWVTFKQDDLEITKTKKDIVINGCEIVVELTQEETLQFKHDRPMRIQARRLTQDDKAFATNIAKAYVGEILKEGVIGNE